MSLLDLDNLAASLTPSPVDDPSGSRIRYGEYLLLIKSTILKVTSKGRCAILRFRVVEARGFVDAEPPNPVDSDCSVVINFDGEKGRSAEFRLHLFICGLFGVSLRSSNLSGSIDDLLRAEDVTRDGWISEANPVRGMLIGLRLAPGGPTARFEWSCVAPPGEGANARDEAHKRVHALALSGDFTSESPVEKTVFRALCARGALAWQHGRVTILGPGWYVFPQYEESIYRLDFALFNGDKKVAFEVDGFAHHDRTPEQARRDKTRDRALQAAGWLTPRFTASEIEEDVERCLSDVFALAGVGGP